MMARSKCSNQRPDKLMQDRSTPARRKHLQRTAGPYIWVNGLNRSRGRALRRAAWPCQQWMERLSVLPDDEGPEARPQNRRSFSMMIARSIIDGVGSAPTVARRHLHRGCFEY